VICRVLLIFELFPCTECSNVRFRKKRNSDNKMMKSFVAGGKRGSLDLTYKFLLSLRSVLKCVLAAGSKTISLFRNRLCTAILASSLLHSLLACLPSLNELQFVCAQLIFSWLHFSWSRLEDSEWV